MKKFMRKTTFVLSIILLVTFCIPNSFILPTQQISAKTLSLNHTVVKASVGEQFYLKLDNITKNIKWSSNNKKVATVSKTGKVYCQKEGTAKITATYKSKKYTCKVTVNKTELPTVTTIISVRGTTIKMGENEDKLVEKLGTPSRIEVSRYGDSTYIYNNDYTKFLMIYIKDDTVVGIYTDSLDFNYEGITSNSTNSESNKNSDYYVDLYVDKIGTGKVVGIRIIHKSILPNSYNNALIDNTERQIYDLTNSVRARNGISILEWSEQAQSSSRKHSEDMAKNNYFSHTDLNGQSSADRMKAVGITWSYCGENIAAGYDDAVEVTFGWFQSSGHRKNMLNESFSYLGIGVAFDQNSDYATYYTQNFYKLH